MAVPKRARLINSRTRGNTKKNVSQIEEKPISEDEHKSRLKKLKAMGLLK